MMLQEIKVNKNRVNKISKYIWKDTHCEGIGSIGKSGGLWIMWDPIKVEAERIG